MCKIDRPFFGFLNDRKVTVISFDIINKIKQNNINLGDVFIFKTDKDTEKKLYNEIKYLGKVNFKTEKYKIDADMNLRYICSYLSKQNEREIVEMHCEIIKNNKV